MYIRFSNLSCRALILYYNWLRPINCSYTHFKYLLWVECETTTNYVHSVLHYINNNIKINLKKEDTPENFLKNDNEGQIKNFNKYIKNIPKKASKDCSISYNTTRSVNKMSKNELSKSGNSCNKIGISIKVHSPPKSKVNRS